MADAVIVGGVRTPFVKAGGALKDTPATDLGQQVVREVFYRFNLSATEVDELIAGNVASPAEAANMARVIALRAGIPKERIAHTVSRNCASGMESLTQAIDRINLGKARCILALGVDSMSNIPIFWSKSFAEKLFHFSQARGLMQKIARLASFRLSDLKPHIGIQMGLTDPVTNLMMGETAEKLAREYKISREMQDAYALQSHQRAVAAWQSDRLQEEVMELFPVPKSQAVTQDIGPREHQTMDALAKLKPYFDRRWGTVTVGNSCQVTDGAVALLVMDAEYASSLGYEPLGRVRSYAYAGCDPSRMGLGPVYSSAKALQSAGMTMREMELVELNEAFAAQVLACLHGFANPPAQCQNEHGISRLSELDQGRLNVNGGAIALGHPVGATGARIVLTLLNELKRRGGQRGLATLCIGGGQGGAVVVERN